MNGAYLGTIVLWPGYRAPYFFMFCRGQLLPIQQYQDLFSVIGCTYGGDGVKDFALPNLVGRGLYGCQTGKTGDRSITLGSSGGQSLTQITAANMPMHDHAVQITEGSGSYQVSGANGTSPSLTVAKLGAVANLYSSAAADSTLVSVSSPVASTVAPADGVESYTLSTQPPSLVLNYIICVNGMYP